MSKKQIFYLYGKRFEGTKKEFKTQLMERSQELGLSKKDVNFLTKKLKRYES